ncbi:aminotransferase class I/II-fold pyridoxal phosphate-dependent enzyme [bacterium]|nr:aminotransferase class I/II-fold pyridoxal phosphate-dependent enzyme [bacterium]
MDMEKLFNKEVMSLETYIMFRLKEQTSKLKDELTKRNRAPISLSMGAPTMNPPKKMIERLKEILDEDGIHTYSVPKGEPYFRKAIAQRMKNRFGVDLDFESEIFSLIGSKEGIANLVRFITTPKSQELEKDVIMIPDPCYASYLQFINCSGAKAYPMPLTKENDYKPDVEKIYNQIIKDGYKSENIKALFINYPNNPLGVSTTKEYVKTVIDFCKKHDILLVSDAAYCDLYFEEDEKPFSIFELEGAKDIGIEFYSFSKPYAITGWRLGWVCGNKDVITRFGKGKSTLDNGIFKALQKVCAEYVNTQDGDKYIEEGNKLYKRKQAIMVKGFKELGWPIDEKTVPHTTFYLWLPIPKRYKSSFEFCQDALQKSGVVLVPGNAFGNCGEGFFRLSYVCSDEQLQEVIDRFKQDGFYYV